VKLFFCNASFALSEQELRARFEQFGKVHDYRLIKEKKTGRSRGYGFVIMNREPAAIAIARLDGQWIKGRRLVVKEAMPPTLPGALPSKCETLRGEQNENSEQSHSVS
jgi:cold-inducible RNA-binding protein